MKQTKPLLRVLAFALALVMLGSNYWPVSVSAASSSWTLKDDTEIFWVKTETTEEDFETLTAQVQLFASELAEKVTTAALPISYGDSADAGENDIILVLDATLEIDAQGYEVKSTDTSIKISASDADGLFYGCRYLIKSLLSGSSVASASEAPDVLERALSLDNGRKYYSVEWIKEMIRELSWADMNALALHFSEEMGLGIESKTYPWLAGRDGTLCTQAEVETDNTYLTQDQVAEIVAYAKLYHVEIIPSFDSPGHMNYIVKKFNEMCATEDYSFTYNGKTYTAEAGSEIGNYFHYNGLTSIVQGSRNKAYSRGIDISNEVAVAFTQSLIEEYAVFFNSLGCTKFDIGGDELLGWGTAVVSTSTASRWQQLDHWKEYAQNRAKAEGKSNWANAVAYDGFMYYMNDLYDLVSGLGYTSVRMWNDDALRSSDTGWNKVVELNTDIDIWFWTTGTNTVWTYATAGYQVYNILSDYNYYAMTSDYFSSSRSSFTQAYADEIYNEWTPFTFDPTSTTLGSGKNTAIGNPNVLGSAFGIWSDNPTLKTEDEVMADVVPMLRAHGAKAWDATENSSVTYSAFAANWAKIGDAPVGTTEASDVYVVADLTELEEAVAEYKTYTATDYDYTTFAAYEKAVEAGKVLLASDKPAQADVDAAVAAIIAARDGLKAPVAVDTSALEAAITAYEAVDASIYTPETFIFYTAAVEEAKELLAGTNYTEQDVADALQKIADAAEGLVKAEDTGVTCFISGSFKASKVYVGKVATLNMSVIKGSAVDHFEIYNDQGIQVQILRESVSTQKSDRDNYCIIFSATQDMAGERTFYVYAVLEDGTRSSDYLELTLTVK